MTDASAASAPAVGELNVTRELDAPREVVFRAFLDPEQIACFWGAAGCTTPASGVIIDPRPGGNIDILMVFEDGTEHHMLGQYLEIVEPELISFKEHGMGLTSTMTFEDLGGRTLLRVHQTDVPADILGPETDAGFNSYLDKVEAYFASRPQ